MEDRWEEGNPQDSDYSSYSRSPTPKKSKRKKKKKEKRRKSKRSKKKKRKSKKKKRRHSEPTTDDRWRPSKPAEVESNTIDPISPKAPAPIEPPVDADIMNNAQSLVSHKAPKANPIRIKIRSKSPKKYSLSDHSSSPKYSGRSRKRRESSSRSSRSSLSLSRSRSRSSHSPPSSYRRSRSRSSSRSRRLYHDSYHSSRSRSRSRHRMDEYPRHRFSRSGSFDRRHDDYGDIDRKRRYSDRDREYSPHRIPPPIHRERPPSPPPRRPPPMKRATSDPARSYLGVRGKETQIKNQVIAALNDIQKKHNEDHAHPLDIKQQELKKDVARREDKAMIWAAASGHFDTEIIHSAQFQKSVSVALKTTNKEFDIATLFRQFSNFSVKFKWLDCSNQDSGITKSELLTFRDLMSIRSYRRELNHCDALWKFIFYEQRHLFWSMAIYYALIGTTLVPEWDAMFQRQYNMISKYGKRQYIHSDIEAMEERAAQRGHQRTPSNGSNVMIKAEDERKESMTDHENSA